jgi:PHD/YefM family antitoxin component YafN of YafNO toxin-antitoxin module
VTLKTTYSVSEARAQLADLLAAIGETGDRVVIERYGKPVGVILHPEEVRILDAIEDRWVQVEADRVRAEGDDGKRYTTEEVLRMVAAAPAEPPPPAPPATEVAARVSSKVQVIVDDGGDAVRIPGRYVGPRFGGRRTTHRASKGTKLYAKRSGRITDVQTYKRAHGADANSRKAQKKK